MSELTTGGINFDYQSPISQIYKDIEYKLKEDMENKTMEAIHHFGISVDKEELIKALQYDRNQYDKGYSDGRASIVEELKKIKEDIMSIGNWKEHYEMPIAYLSCLTIVEHHISELKGE